MPRPVRRSLARRPTIGALSADTGVSIETIRYYERVGLMPLPPRSRGGHRLYDDLHRHRLMFIRRSRALGFSLDATRNLLALASDHELSCAEVKALTEKNIAHVRGKIRGLKQLDRILTRLAVQCCDPVAPRCPILDVLDGRADPADPL